jgi:hypothetical protein
VANISQVELNQNRGGVLGLDWAGRKVVYGSILCGVGKEIGGRLSSRPNSCIFPRTLRIPLVIDVPAANTASLLPLGLVLDEESTRVSCRSDEPSSIAGSTAVFSISFMLTTLKIE